MLNWLLALASAGLLILTFPRFSLVWFAPIALTQLLLPALTRARGTVLNVSSDAAVEAYPQIGAPPDATSAATPAFWQRAGFTTAVDDERFPVVRRELA